MIVRFEEVDASTLLTYERVFFEEVCGLDTSGRDTLSVPIPTLNFPRFR
ncbi:MAG: hypothetical protein IKG69_05100 [Atopobiaceae bacterium]|nr:hypothetical protein [Atopobiaceae bacterium]